MDIKKLAQNVLTNDIQLAIIFAQGLICLSVATIIAAYCAGRSEVGALFTFLGSFLSIYGVTNASVEWLTIGKDKKAALYFFAFLPALMLLSKNLLSHFAYF